MRRLCKFLVVVPLIAIVAVPDLLRALREIWRELK